MESDILLWNGRLTGGHTCQKNKNMFIGIKKFFLWVFFFFGIKKFFKRINYKHIIKTLTSKHPGSVWAAFDSGWPEKRLHYPNHSHNHVPAKLD